MGPLLEFLEYLISYYSSDHVANTSSSSDITTSSERLEVSFDEQTTVEKSTKDKGEHSIRFSCVQTLGANPSGNRVYRYNQF